MRTRLRLVTSAIIVYILIVHENYGLDVHGLYPDLDNIGKERCREHGSLHRHVHLKLDDVFKICIVYAERK